MKAILCAAALALATTTAHAACNLSPEIAGDQCVKHTYLALYKRFRHLRSSGVGRTGWNKS
jgi:hypothetical protein